MKPLYTQSEFNLAKTEDKLPCKCYKCEKIFYKSKRTIKLALKNLDRHNGKYCSKSCGNKTKVNVNCKNCNKTFKKEPSKIKKSKSGNNFCSKSCSAFYNNKHKSHGTRRSKLENWLEYKLTQLHPSIEIYYNQKNAINSELDIYIPSINIAFELNGIFHYEPIYGTNKLQQIQENDVSKSKACHEAKIDLCTIDVSGQKYFKESTSKKYLDIINNIIKERLSIS
jgi:hypothetical protein